MIERPRVVVLAPELPHASIPHAGGRYVGTVVEVLSQHADVVVLVPDAPVNRAASIAPGVPARFHIFGSREDRPFVLRPVFRALSRLDTRRTRRDPSATPWVLAGGLIASPVARRALRASDVVDLQYAQMARLEPLVRRLARRARVVATFHDVRSQRFRRAARHSSGGAERAAYERAARRESTAQSRLLGRLDAAITFSEKDSAELAGPQHAGHVRLLRPPLAGTVPPRRTRTAKPTVLFVGHLARPENQTAVTWFLDLVWPSLVDAVDGVLMRVVGGGAPPTLRARLEREPHVEAPGFVEDLSEEYARAWLSVVPVLDGAGVKFKTVEAVVAGVPVVTTPVGAEGVVEAHAFAGCSDEPAAFAEACRRVLANPEAADARAAELAELATDRFSFTTFRAALLEVDLG